MNGAVNQKMLSSTPPQGLAASGPDVDYAEKLMLFGQFVGDWEVDFTVYGPDGTREIERAEWHFGWVLQGRAIQDVFIIPRRADREKSNWTGRITEPVYDFTIPQLIAGALFGSVHFMAR